MTWRATAGRGTGMLAGWDGMGMGDEGVENERMYAD